MINNYVNDHTHFSYIRIMINNYVNDHTHFSGFKIYVIISDLSHDLFDYGNMDNERWC